MDLYDDLDYALFEPVAPAEQGPEDAPECKKLKTECKAKESKISELSDKIQTLEAQNRILRKNISCLFKTAKAEVQRKDAILQEQRDKIAKLEASMAAETRESGYLGDKVMMMQSASATEQEMLQLWLLHCQQQQLYSGDYTGFCTPGVGQEVYYGTYPNGYYEALSSQKRSAVEECEQSGRRPFRESQTATVAVDKRALSKKPHRHKDRHTSGSKRRSEHRY